MDELVQAWAYVHGARRMGTRRDYRYRIRWAYARLLEAAAPVVLRSELRTPPRYVPLGPAAIDGRRLVVTIGDPGVKIEYGPKAYRPDALARLLVASGAVS